MCLCRIVTPLMSTMFSLEQTKDRKFWTKFQQWNNCYTTHVHKQVMMQTALATFCKQHFWVMFMNPISHTNQNVWGEMKKMFVEWLTWGRPLLYFQNITLVLVVEASWCCASCMIQHTVILHRTSLRSILHSRHRYPHRFVIVTCFTHARSLLSLIDTCSLLSSF